MNQKNLKASEYAHQQALVARLDREGIFIFSIENSLHFPIPEWFPEKIKIHLRCIISKLTQQRKSNGMKNGIPDLLIPPNIFIEMKTTGGKVSEVQKEIHLKLKQLGCHVIVAYSAKEAYEKYKEIINESI